MDSEDCILIDSDDEAGKGGDKISQGDVSVQVIGEVNNRPPSTTHTGRHDTSVIDLTDGNEFSFMSSSQPLARTPSKPFTSSQPTGSYSPPLFLNSPSPTLIPPSPTSSDDGFKRRSSSSNQQRNSSSTAASSRPGLYSSSSSSSSSSESELDLSPKRLTQTQTQTQTQTRPTAKKKGQLKVDKSERERLKQQKLKEKELERVQKEANKANLASRALQNCTAIIDKAILKLINDQEEAFFGTLFEETSLNYKMTSYPKIANSVTWEFKRVEVVDGACVCRTIETGQILIVMEASEYARRIFLFRDNPEDLESLNNFICDIIDRTQAMVVILVYNFNAFLRTERVREAKEHQRRFRERFEGRSTGSKDTATNGNNNEEHRTSNLNQAYFDELRLTLQIDLEHRHPDWKLHIDFHEKTHDIVDSITRYTKSVAGREIKNKEKAISNIDWALNMDKDRAYDPLKDLTKLWIAQLQQFSQITLPIAKTIAAEYPSPSALLDQYKSLTENEAQDLLAELHVQRNLRRQVGQNISRKIYRFLTSKDPDIHIGFD